ncbi:MAG: enoyl-CoA hydratase/isomerase family protein [Burkholderiales bacterium]
MVRIETRGVFVHATLDAPATRNALTDAMVASLVDAVRLAESTPATRALVIRGAGGTFCAGGDFSGFRSAMATSPPADGIDPIATSNRRFGALLEQLRALSVASIAVVDGAAMGGGCGLAAACDIVLAADTAKFAMPEVTLGLPPAQIAPFVAARVGQSAALRLMLTGRRVDAAEALACGLVDQVLAADALDARLDQLLGELARAEPQALRATKAILHRARCASLADTLDFASQAFATSLRSGTATEGLAAFAAKRAPGWAAR